MKPLRTEIDSSDPTLARAAEVLGSASSIEISDLRLRQLKAALIAGGRPRPASWLARPAFVALVLIGTIALAGALIHYRAVESAPPLHRGDLEDAALAHEARPLPLHVTIPSCVRTERSGEPSIAPVNATEEAPTDDTQPEEATPAPTVPEPERPTAQSDEASVLLAATKAWRRAHDPVACLALLSEYGQRYPHGALSEEALALEVEVASETAPRRAAELARRYLERFPNGQFSGLAREALSRSKK